MARADNGIIGAENKLPWHISSDLKHFKHLTFGKPIIMGRKTFESIGKPLKGRTNIVVTRDQEWTADGTVVCNDPKKAQGFAKDCAAKDGVGEIMVAGGAEIYGSFINDADRIYLTEVHRYYDGDACFTALDKRLWKEVSRDWFEPDDAGGPPYSFVVLDRSKHT